MHPHTPTHAVMSTSYSFNFFSWKKMENGATLRHFGPFLLLCHVAVLPVGQFYYPFLVITFVVHFVQRYYLSLHSIMGLLFYVLFLRLGGHWSFPKPGNPAPLSFAQSSHGDIIFPHLTHRHPSLCVAGRAESATPRYEGPQNGNRTEQDDPHTQ